MYNFITISHSTNQTTKRFAVVLALVVASVLVTGCGSEDEGLYEETYDSYFKSFTSDYDFADSLADLADQSEVVTKATLVDVEEGRLWAESDTKPELDPDKPVPADIHVEVNLVFETADDTRYYVGLFRPNDSSVAQIRSVMPSVQQHHLSGTQQYPGRRRWREILQHSRGRQRMALHHSTGLDPRPPRTRDRVAARRLRRPVR